MNVVKISPDSELHTRILEIFRTRLDIARDAQRLSREEAWKTVEDTYLSYIPERDVDILRKSKRSTHGEIDYTTITVPYSYAMLLTSHTYYTSVFLARNPIFQVMGRHGEAQMAESAVEALLDYQLMSGGGLPALYIWLLDVGKYGFGVVGHWWDRESIQTTEYVEDPVTILGVPIPGKKHRHAVTHETIGFLGNRLYNVRPQDFYFDPRKPVQLFQEGEFCAVFDRVSWHQIEAGVAEGKYYNVDDAMGFGFADRLMGSQRIELPGDNLIPLRLEDGKPAMVDLHEFYMKIVPKDFGLGPGSRQEIWVFSILDGRRIISAQPLGLNHGKFPFDVITHEVGNYGLFPTSMLETLDPLNKTLEWLLNSHFYNVRATLNNNYVVDPSMVVMKDLESPEPGLRLRLKPLAFGQDVRKAIMQIPSQDVTRGHLADMSLVGELMQRVGGATDNVMGMLNPGGRRTATEVRTTTTFSVNRLKTNCEWFSAVGWSPLVQKLIASSQQLYDLERELRIVGDLAQWGQKYLRVSPENLQGTYDFVPVDGTLPIDRFAQANLWNSLLGTMSKVPQVMGSFDIAKIFAFIAQLGGLKNVGQFKIAVAPDAAVQAQAQAGNVVPIPSPTRTNLNEPGQIPGLGPTG